MQNKKAIEALTGRFSTLEAPKPVSFEWSRFADQLCDVVALNLDNSDGYALKRSWDFDPEHGHFYFTLKRTLTIEIGPGRRIVSALESTFTFDPRKNIAEEIARVARRAAEWTDALQRMRRAQLAEVLKNQGQEAFDAAARGTIC